ncbi:hypothetical protein A33I_08950 [Alkalihalophilus marmarensis DSM 21297]|uniref:Uncharacterized protein n=1 Tax=Alkalihalophilus marmarensis DSM 21297 TaxID=1188261 RepID=U6SRS7_9BACI|nr:hypothetical protein A33I_08950 [Alkalihalophilus marmarensis DSM 21297]
MEHKHLLTISCSLLFINLLSYPVMAFLTLPNFVAYVTVLLIGMLGISICVLGNKRSQAYSQSIFKNLIILHLAVMAFPLAIYMYGYLVFN